MFNEESGAENCVRTVCGALSRVPNRSRLIVVDDGSRDRTARILDELERQHDRLTVIHLPNNCGYGAALGTGVRRAGEDGFDYTLFMDSDLTNDPRDIPKFTARMEQGWDVIKATRYSLGGGVSGVPLYRLATSALGNYLARLLFRLPIHDSTNGFRAVRTSLLLRMKLREQRFPIIMEELYWCRFLTRSFVEVPVVLTDREAGLRPTSFVYRPSVFWTYLKYPLRAFVSIKPRGLQDLHTPSDQKPGDLRTL
jgi:dolichol-phosphate mannosyltransferase